jgi:anti-anti-sigma factor
MQPFTATWREDGALHLWGELDMAREKDLLSAFVGGWDGQPELVIDLSELRFIDSTGIRALLRLAERTERGVVIRGARENVRRSLEIVRVADWDRVTLAETDGTPDA